MAYFLNQMKNKKRKKKSTHDPDYEEVEAWKVKKIGRPSTRKSEKACPRREASSARSARYFKKKALVYTTCLHCGKNFDDEYSMSHMQICLKKKQELKALVRRRKLEKLAKFYGKTHKPKKRTISRAFFGDWVYKNKKINIEKEYRADLFLLFRGEKFLQELAS